MCLQQVSCYVRTLRHHLGPRADPDLAAAARLLDLGDATETEVREALGSGFPKHPLHKIASIGALVASYSLAL